MSYKDGREYDLEELRKVANSPDPIVRRSAEESARLINRESGAIRSMREALIREHRKGNQGNVRDIHDYIQKHSKYRNDRHDL